MKKTLALAFSCMSFGLMAQSAATPKLVIGIVIDQMRYDYLHLFSHRFTNDGFKRLMREGHTFHDAHYNYVPTYTGPGHASIYTGTTPQWHGIVSNDWYDRNGNKNVYCTADSTVMAVGSTGSVGQHSPHNLIATTVTDELKLASQLRSKVIGIALKDRASILPAGHHPDLALWFDESTGKWSTSTFYTKELPKWVNDYNAKDRSTALIADGWKTLFPLESYYSAFPDANPYERVFAGETASSFPHDLKAIQAANEGGYGVLKASPFGCTITTEIAQEAIKAEQLGKDDVTDMLCVSYSSPDLVGHYYGPRSIEMEDTYARLDRELAALFATLDKEVGKGKYVLFLTADHAAAENAQMLMDLNMPAGLFDDEAYALALNNELKRQFKLDTTYIEKVINQQVYIDHDLVKSKGLDLKKVKMAIKQFTAAYTGIADVMTDDELMCSDWTEAPRALIKQGFMPSRCGDVVFVFHPGWMEYGTQGTTHGSHYVYDTHVPLIWMGMQVMPGNTYERIYITGIAPTVSLLTGVPYPSACTGKPFNKFFQKK